MAQDKVFEIINGELVGRERTSAELAEAEAQALEQERQYWNTVSYDEAVNAEIRRKYSESQEFAILRQKEEKSEEYAQYYTYCEACKAFVREKKGYAL